MLKGLRVLLRPFEKDDLQQAHVYENDVEVRLLAGYRPPLPTSLARMEAQFEKRQKDEAPAAWFAIEVDGNYIGKCGLHKFMQADRTCDLSIVIGDHAYWGKGYGREAVELLLDYAFRIRNVRKVCLVTSSHNERAIRSYLAVGFIEEGRLRKQQWNNGRYVDWVFMGIFAEDWRNKKQLTDQ